jgi:hypothetical protein
MNRPYDYKEKNDKDMGSTKLLEQQQPAEKSLQK